MSEKLSKSEILRRWINDNLDHNFDYTAKQNRTSNFHDFLNSGNNADSFDEKNHKPLFHFILKKELSKRGYSLQSFGLSGTKETIQSDMIVTIEPMPQNIPLNEFESDDVITGDTFIEGNSNDNLPKFEISIESVSSMCELIFDLTKIPYPLIEGLSKEETNTIANMWKPIIENHVKNGKLMIILAIFRSFSLFSRKILDSKRKSKSENQSVHIEFRKINNNFS
jgi:hypothetical protein